MRRRSADAEVVGASVAFVARVQKMARAVALRSFVASLREAAGLPSAGGRLYKNVTLIKAGLGNAADRHYYPARVLQEAVEGGQFKKLKAYADHPTRLDDSIQPERTIRDMVGLYDNVRFVREGERGGRVVGDLKIFKSHRWLSDMVDELVQADAADQIGISINGAGDTEAKDLKEAGGPVNEVLNFRTLHSADIVTEAGAGGGFHTLLESARKERTPMKLKKTDLLAKIAEAAKSGKDDEVVKLSKQLAGSTDGADASAEAEGSTGKVKEAKRRKKDEEAAEEEAVSEAASGDADDDDEAVDGETDEADDDAVDDESRDAGEATREAADAGCGCRESALRAKHRQTKVVEGLKFAKNAKGGASKGASSMTVKSGGTKGLQKGRRYAEADAEVEDPVDDAEATELSDAAEGTDDMREAYASLLAENKALKQRIAVRARESAAKKIVGAIKGLKPDAQKELSARLVRECRSVEQMRQEAGFYTRLLESASARVMDDLDARFGDDEDSGVDGMPARFREGFGGAGVDTPEELLADVGLPIKRTAAVD